MKRIGLIGAVGVLLALSAYCAGKTTAQPTPQESKAKTFLLVEVKGTIGKNFSAAKMKTAIAEARTAKAAAIVLSMDTPGGSVTEAEAIVDLIIENKDLRFIALVNKALSAGAAITLACKDIYVMETATIGAAVSFIPDRKGIPVELPADVAEKFQSAWRAVCRKAADYGGHSSLLAEGMADPGFAITKRTENGKVILERDGKGELVKAAGRILTLTAKEAVACGLAKAVVPDAEGLGAELGMQQWRNPERDEAEVEDDRPTLRLPELRTLFNQYRLIRQEATATEAAVRAKEEEIRKTLVGRTVELGGELQDVRPRGEGFLVAICYRGAMISFEVRKSYGFMQSSYRSTVPSETISISMISADNRWVSAKKGSRVKVTGRIRGINLTCEREHNAYQGKEKLTLFFLRVVISMEELGPQELLKHSRPAREPTSTASAPVDPEAEARKQLNLAENYRRAGLASTALRMLRSIVEDFPNTGAAKKAQEQIKQLLQDEAKKASKDS